MTGPFASRLGRAIWVQGGRQDAALCAPIVAGSKPHTVRDSFHTTTTAVAASASSSPLGKA